MTPPKPEQFAAFYEAVTTYKPFPWHERLAQRVCAGTWPRCIALPTAAGKTACIDIAVFALACRAKDAPRRIFFVVDRRIVVDQAFEHAKVLGRVLDRANEGVRRDIADQLREVSEPGWLQLSASDRQRILEKRWEIQDEADFAKRQRLLKNLIALEKQWFEISPLDVYALRGGMYRETAWTRSPLQPTVIASTVDQVGSRLLFRGYGVSDSMKPVHAGLVGNDALILLDEAHCAKPFDQTMQAVKHYRAWNDATPPFHFISLTATPSEDVRKAEQQRAIERPEEKELILEADDEDKNHDVLGKRFTTSKPATLDVAKKNKLLEKLQAHAEALMGADLGTDAKGVSHSVRAVGIIVNRVKMARDLAKALREVKAKKGTTAEPRNVILLTGRMRPVDRDVVLKQLEPLFSGSKLPLEKPTFVVATQCLEVGADLDFHALVTECASLDALRQRFGRLNRVASRPSAKAVIVCREEYTEPKEKEKEQDPIYGNSLPLTWKFLHGENTRTEFDFSVTAMTDATDGIDLTTLNAPALDAPVLFPAHLDCWVQTHPIPTPDPDVALFLHGPKQLGQPDVQVVFRNDLGGDPSIWADIVALCPPSSSEAVAVPIGTFKKWLAGEAFEDQSADVDGSTPDAEDDEESAPQKRFVLCWKGPEDKETQPVSKPNLVEPNRTYVVPCDAPEVKLLGDFPPNPIGQPEDFAEEAYQRSRDKALLRLPNLTIPEDATDDERIDLVSEALAAMDAALTDESFTWLRRAVKALQHPKTREIEFHPTGGLVVRGKKRLGQFDPTYLDDSEPAESFRGNPVTLEVHSRGVADHAARFAAACGLPVETYTLAGQVHDLGKLDPRFQKLLKGYAAGPPLAKSGSFARRDWAVHQYPKGARHELLSAAILAKDHTSDDLLLHLVATHHGSARPFAEPVDENDAARSFAATICELSVKADTAKQDIAAWNAELPERFWRIVRKYGWWGAAYREAVFRLADHAQSRAEQDPDFAPSCPAFAVVPTLPPRIAAPKLYPLPLPGLDGSNPLAYLAALGTLRLVDQLYPGTRLSWERRGHWTAVLHTSQGLSPQDLVAALIAHPDVNRRCLTFAVDLKIAAADFRTFQVEAQDMAQKNREFSDFLAAFADPLIVIQGGPNVGKTKPTEFYFIAGQQKLVRQARDIAAATKDTHLHKCLFTQWSYDDPLDGFSLRWDPCDDFRYATRFFNPSKDKSKAKRGSVLGANRLAFDAMPFFPCFARGNRLATTAFIVLKRRPYFTWPIWTCPWGVAAVRSVLSRIELPRNDNLLSSSLPRSELDIAVWNQAEKVPNSDYSNFAPACVL